MNKEAVIRARAYAIWEAEGCPEGRDEQHWQQAALELAQAETEANEPAVQAPIKRRRAAPTPSTPPSIAPEPAGTAVSPRKRKSASGEPKPEPKTPKPKAPRAR